MKVRELMKKIKYMIMYTAMKAASQVLLGVAVIVVFKILFTTAFSQVSIQNMNVSLITLVIMFSGISLGYLLLVIAGSVVNFLTTVFLSAFEMPFSSLKEMINYLGKEMINELNVWNMRSNNKNGSQ
jgi:hypothetical protein